MCVCVCVCVCVCIWKGLGLRGVFGDIVACCFALFCLNRICFQTLNWELSADVSSIKQCSLVIGSDVLYLPASCPHILRSVLALLQPGGTCLIADPGRAAADQFLALCRAEPRVLTYNHTVFPSSLEPGRVLRVIEVHVPVASASPTDRGAAHGAEPGGPDLGTPLHASLLRVFSRHRASPPDFCVTAFGE